MFTLSSSGGGSGRHHESLHPHLIIRISKEGIVAPTLFGCTVCVRREGVDRDDRCVAGDALIDG